MGIKRYIQRVVYRLRGYVTTEELVNRGLIIGNDFNRMHDVNIDDSHCWLISIGDSVTLAPNVTLLAHDASTKIWLGYTKIGRVEIGNRVFVGAGTIVLPGVTIGDDVIIGAGSVVSKSLDSNGVYVGNPCIKICALDEYLDKHKRLLENSSVFDEKYILGNIDDNRKLEMRGKLGNGIGYIV